MDDSVQRNLAELQKGMADLRHDVQRGFRWTIVTVAVGMIITWFGVVMLLARGAALLRRAVIG